MKRMSTICCILGASLTTLAAEGFTLVSPTVRARVVVGESEPGYVFRAAQDLTNDVKKITGTDLALVRGGTPRPGDMSIATRRGGAPQTFAGRPGPHGDGAPQTLAGRPGPHGGGEWEAYEVTVKDGVLSVAGSDARGTMFGIYDFIERCLKVDPLSFWNGTPYPKSDTLAWERVDIRQASPTFRFRGWFINDEDFRLKESGNCETKTNGHT